MFQHWLRAVVVALLPACIGLAHGEPTGWRMSLSLQSAPAAPTSLAASDWRALLNSAQQAAANRRELATVEAADASHEQAQISAWRPRVDANASSTQRWQRYNDQPIRTPASALGLTLTQPLWRAADRAVADSLQSQAEQARWQAQDVQQRVALELSLAWLDAVEATETLRLNEARIAALHTQARLNERRLQAGVGTVVDQLETRSLLEQAQAERSMWQRRLDTARLQVERLVGHAVRVPAGLRAWPDDAGLTMNDPLAVPPEAEGVQQAPQVNAAQLARERQLQAARQQLEARQAERWQPTIDVVAELSHSRQSQQFDGQSERQDIRNRAVGVQLNWPLFTSGYQHARTREALALVQQAEAARDDERAQLSTNVRDAYDTLHHSHRLLAVQRDVVRTAQTTHDAVYKAYLAGLRTHQDLLNARQRIDDSRQALVGTRIQALKAQVRILSLLGQLSAEHLTPLASVLEREAVPTHTPDDTP